MLNLNIPPWKLFRWFRKPQLWATGDWQLHHDNVPAHASHLMQFFGETSNHSGDLAPLQTRFSDLQLLAFPKTKITFERVEISDPQWDSGKYDRAADGDWENCVRSQGTYFEGDWGITVLCAMFLVSSISVSIFLITWLDTFWTDLIYHVKHLGSKKFPLQTDHVPYFAMYNALPCITCTHMFMHVIHRLCPLLYPWHVVIIPMYNMHPYVTLKNLSKKCTLYMAKYGNFIPVYS